MRRIQIADLMSESFNVTGIEAVERTWKDGNVNRYPDGRSENIISYTLQGEKRIFDCKGKETRLSAPALVWISKGTPYLSRTVLEGREKNGHTICIRFALSTDDGEELIVDDSIGFWKNDPDGALLHLCQGVLAAYLATDACPMLLKARMYELLRALCRNREEKHLPRIAKQLLPALKQIETHPEQNTSVCELAAMCFLSESYFRVQFRAHTGYSPADYRNRLRIEKAQELLDSSLWTTELVAEKLGFCDTSHFYRVYKKMTGHTPRKSRE